MQLNMSADEKRYFVCSARLHELRVHRQFTRVDGSVMVEVRHEPADSSQPIRVVGRCRVRTNVVELQTYFPGVSLHFTDERHFEQCVRDTLIAYRHPGKPMFAAFDLDADKPEDGSSSLPLVVRSHIKQIRAGATV
jgi:hypothetical protein